MRNLVWLVLFVLISFSAFAQASKLDSLDRLIAKATTDTARINLQLKKIHIFSNTNLDSAVALGLSTLTDAQKIHYYRGELEVRFKIASNYCFKGDYKAALEQLTYLMHFIQPAPDSVDLGKLYGKFGLMYGMQSKYDSAILFDDKAIGILEKAVDTNEITEVYINIAIAYQQQSNFPMALVYHQKTLKIAEVTHSEVDQAYTCINMALLYLDMGDSARAEKNFLRGAALGKKNELKDIELYAYSNLSAFYGTARDWRKGYDFAIKAAILGEQTGDIGMEASNLSRAAIALANNNRPDSAIILSDRALLIADSSKQPLNLYQAYSDRGSILRIQQKWKEAIKYFEKSFLYVEESDIYTADYGENYKELAECYERTGNYSRALTAYKKAAFIADSVRSRNNIQKATELNMNFEFDKKQQLQKAEQKAKDAVQSTKQLALITALVLVLALAVVSFIGFTNKKKDNVRLQEQKKKIEQTLSQLKSTQAQLIQSEKMASLGELTAGIAHEIQNPLNFVNNFSEVNKEMIAEMKEEINKGNYDEVKIIADDIESNEEKINHHGKRADAIVKGMLQHSRTSSGQKEPTDINALCNEYLRLSFHGMRAKDKEFNAEIKTDFDESIDKINIVPQDIGRVLLNLYNNAFYAVNEKQKTTNENYKPLVSVQTKKLNSNIEIVVKDNGNGISQNIIDKIFQPFFTTKPTGQGTGLGLSLVYDIIKAHGAEIKVETKEGEGSEFIFQLMINS